MAAKYSLQSIPPDKLLHYVNQRDLQALLGPDRYRATEQQLRQAGIKVTAKSMKSVLASNASLIAELRNSPVGNIAYGKYHANYLRMMDPAMREKRGQTREAMAGPRQGMLGCLATKIAPSDYQNCTQNYDNPEYQDISIIPYQALKQSAYQKTRNPLLAPSAKQAAGHISQLPAGLRAYILSHPADYEDYLQERKAELKLLKSVRQNLRREAASGQAVPQILEEPVELQVRSSQAKRKKPTSTEG